MGSTKWLPDREHLSGGTAKGESTVGQRSDLSCDLGEKIIIRTSAGKPLARNQLEIQFFGLQRSGNHAVLSWIFQQFDEPVFFFNNVTHFSDPIRNFHYANLPNMVPVTRGPAPDNPLHELAHARAQQRLEDIRSATKHVLVLSYENLSLPKLRRRELLDAREEWIGKSDRIRRVLLVRDFYNWLASRLRLFENKGQNLPLLRGIEEHVSLWIMYAKEYLEETNFLQPEDVVTISYNRWLGDATYRANLLGRLTVPLKDNANCHVPDVGGGSSFDGKSFSGDPEKMRLDERWRYLLEDKFAGLIGPIRERIDEIERYNLQIFGLSSPI